MMVRQSLSLVQACTQRRLCGSQASPAGQVLVRVMHCLSVRSQVCAGSPQSASPAQGLSESGTQALESPQALPGKQRLCPEEALAQVSPLAQPPDAPQAATQNLPAAGKDGWAAQALPAPHSLSLVQGWQNRVIALQVRSAVLQYWPAPQAASEVQPPTLVTQLPVKALQKVPAPQAASPVQTQRRIS